ncbi:transcriptional regulator [Thiohalobacter thiocyanaticus]|uniref:Transcriptional regulator n=1 Tax=Thiohalobacter thiocyanaticus TaxID=585455 RepID=A0A1Z4VN96_9GAMM|nr:LysR family transcriptional regulator [Thiohalobacter thiocyanaticus]BAZ92704.1 transcriptional regulator [Thiohalobacter thiocyanaticus]
METELLRTFLEVHRMHSFSQAAENLSVTPSAVSARIRQLEGEIGRPVFRRSSQQVTLTPAGERLLRHAQGIVQAWERAQRAAGEDERTQIVVAGVASFWDIFLQDWLNRVYRELPGIAPWVEVSTAARVAEKLIQGDVHLGFLYSPPQHAGLVLREVERMELVLVSTRPGQAPEEALARDYVFVNWGTAFSSQHDRQFPHRPPGAARSNSGRVALGLIQACGGGAYLPLALVRRDLDAGRLYRLEDAPVFELHAYAAWSARGEHAELVERMLGCL